MHHRLSKFYRFAPELPADANWAEAYAHVRFRRPIRAYVGAPLGLAILLIMLSAATTPGMLWSQTLSAPSYPNLAKGGVSRANLFGRVADQTGKPLANLEIAIKDSDGNLLRTVRTNSIGRYCFTDLPTGNYWLTQDPARAPFDGQTVVTSLPAAGLYIDWRVTSNSAIALASTPQKSFTCGQFLAGDNLLEKIFGAVGGDMLASGSIAVGLGVAA